MCLDEAREELRAGVALAHAHRPQWMCAVWIFQSRRSAYSSVDVIWKFSSSCFDHLPLSWVMSKRFTYFHLYSNVNSMLLFSNIVTATAQLGVVVVPLALPATWNTELDSNMQLG
jgi:hypothetical protein